MSILSRLKELGIELPADAAPGARYTPAVVHQSVAYVSGQLPRDGDIVQVLGKVGEDVTLEDAKRGARLAFVRTLAAFREAIGDIEQLDRVLRLVVYVNSAADFTRHSQVADGASELIFDLLGPERGQHARTTIGVAQVPRNAALEIEATIAIKPRAQTNDRRQEAAILPY